MDKKLESVIEKIACSNTRSEVRTLASALVVGIDRVISQAEASKVLSDAVDVDKLAKTGVDLVLEVAKAVSGKPVLPKAAPPAEGQEVPVVVNAEKLKKDESKSG